MEPLELEYYDIDDIREREDEDKNKYVFKWTEDSQFSADEDIDELNAEYEDGWSKIIDLNELNDYVEEERQTLYPMTIKEFFEKYKEFYKNDFEYEVEIAKVVEVND